MTRVHQCQHYGNLTAAKLLSVLKSGHVAAITLPVFHDAASANLNNWNSFSAEQYGQVIDPPPGAVADDGHAVCVVGFVPDQTGTSSGHFLFRNSWGDAWATDVTAKEALAKEAGYGYVSSNFVDRCGWEILAM